MHSYRKTLPNAFIQRNPYQRINIEKTFQLHSYRETLPNAFL